MSDTTTAGGDTPGDSTVKCKAKKGKPEKKQTVEPKITVVNAAVWFHGTIETNLDEVGAIKLKAEKRDDNLGYSGVGNLTANNTQVKFFSDKKCKKPIDPAAGPVAYKFGTLCSEVTIYYKGALAGATGLTLTLEPADDARITVQGPATGAVQAKLANVVTPKLELEHKLVLFNRKLDGKQGSGEGKILPSATYIEASATQTDATSPFTKTGKLSFAPANVEVFTDAACTKPFNRDLTAAELLGAQPFKLWLRGKKAGKFKAKLTLADPATPSVRREKNPTPEEEMGVVELLLKLHQHDISALKGSSMQVDPDTDPDTKYHTDLLAKKLPDQKLMTDAEKIGVPKTGDAEKPGRLLHAQANAAFGRARLVIGKIKAEHLPADTDDYDIVLNFGRGVAPAGTKPEELQGDPADVPATGAIAVCDAEFDGATVAAPSFKVSVLKAAEKILWVEGTTPTDTPCDVRLDIGFDRPAGGLAKTVKRNGDWARFTVVQIKEIKLDYKPTGGSPVQWNAARNEFYINMKSDPDGRKITIQAELTKKLKNVPLYFMLAPDKDNRKDAGWGHTMPTTWKWKDIAQKFKHKDKDKPKNFLHLSEKTDADGKAKKEDLLLSRFGGDRFMPACYVEQDPHLAKYVEGNVGLEKHKPSMAADKIAVSRMFWYQLIEVTGVANPGVAGAVGQYEMVKARMEQAASKVVNPAPAGSLYPASMVTKAGGGGNVLLVSDLNKNSFFTGLTDEADKPIKVPILVCDAQWDTGPDTNAFNSGWVTAWPVTAATNRLLVKPYLDGGDLLVSGEVQCTAPDGGGGWVTGPTAQLTEANLTIDPGRGAKFKEVVVNLPAAVDNWVNANPGANVAVVGLVLRGAKGPYLGESFGKNILAVYEPAEAADFQNTITHELGHGFQQTLRTGKQVAAAPALKTQYISYDSDGMSTGSHCNHSTNKCVMYESGPIVGSLNRYCDDCHPYLLSLDMTKYG